MRYWDLLMIVMDVPGSQWQGLTKSEVRYDDGNVVFAL